MGRDPQLSSIINDQTLLLQEKNKLFTEEELNPNLVSDDFIKLDI